MTSKPVAVVTGTTPGTLGWGIAKVLLQHGWYVFGSVRKEADAAQLREEFASYEGAFHPLLLDVTDRASVEKAAAQVEKVLDGGRLTALVNNSGIAISGPAVHQGLDEFRQMMDVNLYGVITVTQVFLPLLAKGASARGPSPGLTPKIVMVSSTAGQQWLPFLSGYVASKHALEGYSKALRVELLPYGVEVSILGPGVIKTKIFGKAVAGEGNAAKYAATPYARPYGAFLARVKAMAGFGHTPEQQGRQVLAIVAARRPPLRVAYVFKAFKNWYLRRLLPVRYINATQAGLFGLLPGAFWAK